MVINQPCKGFSLMLWYSAQCRSKTLAIRSLSFNGFLLEGHKEAAKLLRKLRDIL